MLFAFIDLRYQILNSHWLHLLSNNSIIRIVLWVFGFCFEFIQRSVIRINFNSITSTGHCESNFWFMIDQFKDCELWNIYKPTVWCEILRDVCPFFRMFETKKFVTILRELWTFQVMWQIVNWRWRSYYFSQVFLCDMRYVIYRDLWVSLSHPNGTRQDDDECKIELN